MKSAEFSASPAFTAASGRGGHPRRRRESSRSSPVPGGARTPRSGTAPAAGDWPDLPRVVRRRSRLHGWGMFALQDIPKNTRIIPYLGEKISHAESLRRERRYLEKGHIWCFKLNNRWVIDAGVGGNDARFVNHSCSPNCYSQIIGGVIWIRAAKTIRAGAELTYDYHTDGEGLIQCRCTPGCTHRL